MRYHELQPHKGGVDLLIKASTKAGLVGAALQGFAEAMGPQYAQDEETARITERPFKVEAEDFSSLLAALLREAHHQAVPAKESYDEARLALITDRKVTGELLGRQVTGFHHKAVKVRDGFAVQRNEHNEWQTTITLDLE